jgi:hypothetical protein
VRCGECNSLNGIPGTHSIPNQEEKVRDRKPFILFSPNTSNAEYAKFNSKRLRAFLLSNAHPAKT